MEDELARGIREVARLRRMIAQIEQVIDDGGRSTRKRNGSGARGRNGKRERRTGAELVQFRRMLKAERKRGVPVTKLAQKHGITPAYIYQMG
jgi:hypothetical protein